MTALSDIMSARSDNADKLAMLGCRTAGTLALFCAVWQAFGIVDDRRQAREWNPQTPVECASGSFSYERLPQTQFTEAQANEIRGRIASGTCRILASRPG